MTELQKTFFGITLGLLISLIVMVIFNYFEIPLWGPVLIIVLVGISSLTYDGKINLKGKKKQSNKHDDLSHLKWIYDRLRYVHKENVNYDYMIKLKEIIDQLEKQNTDGDTIKQKSS